MCLSLAQVGPNFALRKKQSDMKNTEYNLETLGILISADSLRALLELTDDLGLEVTGDQQ